MRILPTDVLAKLYVVGWLFRTNELIGRAAALFYRLLYRNFSLGRHPRIWGRFNLMMFPGSRVQIGDGLHMVSAPARSGITLHSRCGVTAFPGAEIRIGNNVGLNGTAITSKKRIEIGDGTLIAPNVIIIDSDFHAYWPPETRFISSTADTDREVVIGKNVWIGVNSVIAKGSRIGDNSVICACSLVLGRIPANVLAGGNPARVLRRLGPSPRPTAHEAPNPSLPSNEPAGPAME